jgi:hypothetical protein
MKIMFSECKTTEEDNPVALLKGLWLVGFHLKMNSNGMRN